MPGCRDGSREGVKAPDWEKISAKIIDFFIFIWPKMGVDHSP